MNTKIIPAIMPKKFDEISELVGLVRYHTKIVQLDIMDGKFVPEPSWPFFYNVDHDLAALVSQEHSLPFWEDIDYELDLMVERPEESIDTWLGIGAARIIFHYASVYNWEKIKTIDHGIRNFVQIGLAVTIHDNLEDIYSLIDDNVVDFVQVMGIAHIGYQGEPFEQSSLGIIAKLHKKYPQLLITVDGGVSLDTISELSQAGVSEFVSGSGVYGTGTVEENIENLNTKI